MAQLCHHTPLALRLIAGLLTCDLSLDLESHIRVLSEQVEQIATYRDRPEALVEVFIHQAYERLDPCSQQAVCQLGVFLEGFNQTAAAALANIDGNAHEDIDHHLDTLSQLNLLAFDEPTKSYRMHGSVRAFAL